MSQNLIIISLTHPEQLKFLRQVFDTYIHNGMAAEQLPLAADTYVALANAREIPLAQNLGKATIADAGPGGLALEFEPEHSDGS